MNAHARALNFEKNFDTSKLQVINNFVISTLIMGSNSYSEGGDYLEGRACNFVLRTNYNKIDKSVERWPDSSALIIVPPTGEC